MQYKAFFRSDVAKLSYIYIISNFFLLLNYQGIYWDDWVLYHEDAVTIMKMFSMHTGWDGYIHRILLPIGNGIFIYRFLTILLYSLSGIFVYRLLQNLSFLEKEDKYYLSLFYLIAPLYSARIALIDFPYTLSLFFFYLAFYLLSKYINHHNIILRLGILIIFYLSFLTNSLLVFYAIPLMYLFYKKYYFLPLTWGMRVKRFLFQNMDFILLPILFYGIKMIYFKPSELYIGYNALGLKSLVTIPSGIVLSFYTTFIDPINQSLAFFPVFWIFLLIYLLLADRNIRVSHTNISSEKLLLLGVLFFVLGVFAYVAVGKLPSLKMWNSRFQLLAPLGFSFILYFLIQAFVKKFSLKRYMQVLILNTFVLAFVSLNIYDGYRYQKDWFYQIALEEKFKASPIVQKHSTFVAKVMLGNALAKGRDLPYYEQNGRLKKVFGEDSRLMVSRAVDISIFEKYKKYKHENFSTWEYEKPVYMMISKNISLEDRPLYMFKMLYYQMVNQRRFRQMAKELIRIEIKEKNGY